MAEDTFPCSRERAEIDTTLPFRSVKAAVSLFGEKIDAKKCRLPEKHGAKEAHLHELQEELDRVRLQLTDAEKDKAQALAELNNARNLLKAMPEQSGKSYSSRQTGIDDPLANLNADEIKQKTSQSDEKHVVWEVQLKAAQKQHMTAVAELEAVKKELVKLQQELLVTVNEKDSAIRQVEEALAAAEFNAKRVEELSTEISGTNESLLLVKLACIEASKERKALLAAKMAGSDQRTTQASEQDFALVRELELKLEAATEELALLRGELMAAKKAETRVAGIAADAVAALDQSKLELATTQVPASASSSANAPPTALDLATAELGRALDNGTSLQAAAEALQIELDTTRKALDDLREREATATATATSLACELSRAKAELAAALAAESKAKDAILGLSQTIEQIKAEAQEAKQTAEAMREEAHRAAVDAEQAKAAMNTAESKLQAILKEAEAAKAAERAALGRFKELFEEADAVKASEAGVGISVSKDEYDALRKGLYEGEELQGMRTVTQVDAVKAGEVGISVSKDKRDSLRKGLYKRGKLEGPAAVTKVDAVKAGGSEVQQRLETLNEDTVTTIKNTTDQAALRAEMAEAAKWAVETEMRRWREKELQQEARVPITTAQENYLQMKGTFPPLVASHIPQTESLGQVLKIKIPALEKAGQATDQALVQKKKKLLPSLAALLGKKKNPTTISPSSSFLAA